MNFYWLQDLNPMTNNGGAQNTDRAHIIEGFRRGHNIRIVTPGMDIAKDSTDTVIVSNMGSFSVDDFKGIAQTGKKIIWFYHDYLPICKYRLYFPMRDKCRECYLQERWLPVLQEAILHIWLSPLHRNAYIDICKPLQDLPYAIVPSPIDPSQFYDQKLYIRDGAIAVSALHDFKGRANLISYAQEFPDMPITVTGGNQYPDEPLPPNIKLINGLLHESMNELYNKYEYFLHLPNSPMPFDRAPVEAYLAGCKIRGNPLIGSLSYDWFNSREEVAQHVGSASTLFWDKIEEAVGC